MKPFPLIRIKYSNEHIMAALFFVLVLYQLPAWVAKPALIINFLVVFASGLFIDLICNIIRYKKPICSVSAAVSVGIIEALYPGLPIWGGILGVTAALILGKHLFGGTGKNIFNPAMIGAVLLSFVFQNTPALFSFSIFIIPAVILSIPFIMARPYAASGFISSLLIVLTLNQLFGIQNIIAYGVFFWGCIIITDPVTVTYRPVIGLVGGLSAGLASMFFIGNSFNYYMPIIILSLNIALYIAGIVFPVKPVLKCNGNRIGKKVPYFRGGNDKAPVVYNDQMSGVEPIQGDFDSDEILKRIKECDVLGLGGAAFPVYNKILTVMNAQTEKKFFIINAVECDPGLIHDHWLLSHYSKEIYQGIELVRRLASFNESILTSKDTSELNFSENLKIKKVHDFYPGGAEKVLIKNVLGIDLPYDAIPAEHGILVMNVQTVYAVYQAVCFNKKASSRFITVADLNSNESCVVMVELGTKIGDVVETVYPGKGIAFKGGGLMQSVRVYDEDVVDKNTNFIAVGAHPRYKESLLCSKCGLCAENCPSRLEVFKIADLVDKGEVSKTLKYEPARCISCGACSYYCLAGRNLSSKVKAAKKHFSDLTHTH